MLAASLRTFNIVCNKATPTSAAPTHVTTHRQEARVPLVVCGTILARNEFKLFAGVSCIKGSFLSKTLLLLVFFFFIFSVEVEKRNYLITTIIKWNGPKNF